MGERRGGGRDRVSGGWGAGGGGVEGRRGREGASFRAPRPADCARVRPSARARPRRRGRPPWPGSWPASGSQPAAAAAAAARSPHGCEPQKLAERGARRRERGEGSDRRVSALHQTKCRQFNGFSSSVSFITHKGRVRTGVSRRTGVRERKCERGGGGCVRGESPASCRRARARVLAIAFLCVHVRARARARVSACGPARRPGGGPAGTRSRSAPWCRAPPCCSPGSPGRPARARHEGLSWKHSPFRTICGYCRSI